MPKPKRQRIKRKEDATMPKRQGTSSLRRQPHQAVEHDTIISFAKKASTAICPTNNEDHNRASPRPWRRSRPLVARCTSEQNDTGSVTF